MKMISLAEMKQKAFNNNVSQIQVEIVPDIAGGMGIDQKMVDEFMQIVYEHAKTTLQLDAIDIRCKVYKV